MSDIIRFNEVSKVYKGDIVALEKVTFKADKGEFFFIIGPSGAGKSTLIRLLIRQEYPTEGTIQFEAIEVPDIPRRMLAVYRQHIGVVYQELNLLENKNIEENVRFALEITRKPKKEMKEKTEHLLEQVGLVERRKLYPEDLSGGERQKVAIARALANDPKLFIADEPTGNLDPDTTMEILEILKNINETGTTVMVVSHDKELVNAMNTRVLHMEKGKIIEDYQGGYHDRRSKEKGKEKKEVKQSKEDEKMKDSKKSKKSKKTKKNAKVKEEKK